MTTLHVNTVYEDRTGDRWLVIYKGPDKPFSFLAQRVDDKRVRNWYTLDGRWSMLQQTDVDLVEECVK
jgi:hypothetical protein